MFPLPSNNVHTASKSEMPPSSSSLDEVRNRFSQLTPAELDRPTDFFGEQTTVRGVYLRIFAHVNEHYGQSVAYARVNGIVPPWSHKPE